ncbi:MAG: SigE family RNA polymerase sigma factor, partial [Actinomycetota bacterium]|nr:SigE family RNA polymerase sigma factor [Actinomycetota bacterium]
MCGDWHLAEDLVQTTLGKLYVAWRKVQRAD